MTDGSFGFGLRRRARVAAARAAFFLRATLGVAWRPGLFAAVFRPAVFRTADGRAAFLLDVAFGVVLAVPEVVALRDVSVFLVAFDLLVPCAFPVVLLLRVVPEPEPLAPADVFRAPVRLAACLVVFFRATFTSGARDARAMP